MQHQTERPSHALPYLGFGLGLRHPHYDYILQHQPPVDWFEIISENYMADFGWNRHVLMQIRERYPVVMHGVSLSIGSTDELNWAYLSSLKSLAADLEPSWVSDHLCWTGVNGINTHDLLPLPLTQESLNHVCDRILRVQDYLQRPLVLENPSTYLTFAASQMEEWEFLNQLHAHTGCGLLMDVNNVYVSARNHGFDANEYIDKIDYTAIVQVHLSGHTDMGDHCIDTHDQPVCKQVWELYARLRRRTGAVSTMIEWDANLPSFPELITELEKAKNETAELINADDTSGAVCEVFESPGISTPLHFLAGGRA